LHAASPLAYSNHVMHNNVTLFISSQLTQCSVKPQYTQQHNSRHGRHRHRIVHPLNTTATTTTATNAAATTTAAPAATRAAAANATAATAIDTPAATNAAYTTDIMTDSMPIMTNPPRPAQQPQVHHHRQHIAHRAPGAYTPPVFGLTRVFSRNVLAGFSDTNG